LMEPSAPARPVRDWRRHLAPPVKNAVSRVRENRMQSVRAVFPALRWLVAGWGCRDDWLRLMHVINAHSCNVLSSYHAESRIGIPEATGRVVAFPTTAGDGESVSVRADRRDPGRAGSEGDPVGHSGGPPAVRKAV